MSCQLKTHPLKNSCCFQGLTSHPRCQQDTTSLTHLSVQIPPGQDGEMQGPEAPLQLLTVDVGALSGGQTRVSGEIDIIEDQAVSAGIRFHLIVLAGTCHN